MKFLISSDLHLSDSAKDAVRFKLFPWLAEQQNVYKTDATFILGDICEKKDYHSSELVNKIVEGLQLLKPPVYINKGNHDYIREDLPFFKFLNNIEGLIFCTEPTLIKEFKVLMIPHQTSQAAFDKACHLIPNPSWGVMLHQTIDGAISETNSRLAGFSATVMGLYKPRWVYSGDIHKPQQCPPVTYIGAPFHVRHGGQYKPRVLLFDNDKEIDLHFPAPKKLSLTIRDISEMPKLAKGDQVKITLELPRSETVEWANQKRGIIDYCKKEGLEVYGIDLKVPQARKRARLDDLKIVNKSNMDYFQAFCTAEKTSTREKEVGLKLIEGN